MTKIDVERGGAATLIVMMVATVTGTATICTLLLLIPKHTQVNNLRGNSGPTFRLRHPFV